MSIPFAGMMRVGPSLEICSIRFLPSLDLPLETLTGVVVPPSQPISLVSGVVPTPEKVWLEVVKTEEHPLEHDPSFETPPPPPSVITTSGRGLLGTNIGYWLGYGVTSSSEGCCMQ